MPYVLLSESPLVPGKRDVSLYYRDHGTGTPLMFLHGGWGYEIYPFDKQIAEFGESFKIIIPDRSGYGKSTRIDDLPVDFHRRAATEMIHFLDAMKIERCLLWGHSDGAVIAVWMGLNQPNRFSGIILEAFHYYGNKPASRAFFENGAANPDELGSRVSTALANEHGEDYWRSLIRIAAGAWLKLADQAPHPKADLFDGKLGQLTVPTILIHGDEDPRTEPDELAAVRRDLPGAAIHVIADAGHSPHSETEEAPHCNRFAREFFRKQGPYRTAGKDSF